MSFSFSYNQEEYNELTEGARRYLNWNNKQKTWIYHNCKVTIVEMNGQKVRIVLRRIKTGYSSFMKSDFSVNLMMGFVALNSSPPQENNGKWELRFDIEQSNNEDHRDLSQVKIWSDNKELIQKLYEEILEKMDKVSKTSIFSAEVKDNNDNVATSMVPSNNGSSSSLFNCLNSILRFALSFLELLSKALSQMSISTWPILTSLPIEAKIA